MKSAERRIKLMLLLQQPGGDRLTAAQLAERFNVSRRTIFRDLKALQEINVPVTWDKYSGYGMMKGYKIPPLMFTARELGTILVGLNFVKSQVDADLSEDAQNVELKIRNVLPGELKDFMNALEGNMIVDPYLRYGGEKKKGGSWYMISSAIAQKKRLQFLYTRKDGKKETRKVDPYLLVFYDDHWNMIGRSHLRNDFRNFILDQVEKVEILEENYTPKPDVDAEALIFRSNETSHLIDVYVQKDEIGRLEANLPAKILNKEMINSEEIKVSFNFNNLDYINEWLLQFGKKVSVKAPASLIEKRQRLLKEMLQ